MVAFIHPADMDFSPRRAHPCAGTALRLLAIASQEGVGHLDRAAPRRLPGIVDLADIEEASAALSPCRRHGSSPRCSSTSLRHVLERRKMPTVSVKKPGCSTIAVGIPTGFQGCRPTTSRARVLSSGEVQDRRGRAVMRNPQRHLGTGSFPPGGAYATPLSPRRAPRGHETPAGCAHRRRDGAG